METKILKQVWFSNGGDGVTALYIDGSLQVTGDAYHDKIDEYLEGFTEGLKYGGVDFDFEDVQCENLDYIEGTLDIPVDYDAIEFN